MEHLLYNSLNELNVQTSPQLLVAEFQAVTNQSLAAAITSPVPFQNFSQTSNFAIEADATNPNGSIAMTASTASDFSGDRAAPCSASHFEATKGTSQW